MVDYLTAFSGTFTSVEEPKAATDAIKVLGTMSQSRLHALEWSEALNLSAKDHCEDIGGAGLRGHFGQDQSSPFDRILKYGKPGWWRGENLVYDGERFPLPIAEVDEMAQKIVLKMFIDEGIAGRPNRSRMLNPEFKLVGIHSCNHG